MPTEDDYTPTERVGLVVWHLAHGEGMSTANVSEMIGVSRQGAWKLMCALSRVLPFYQDDDGVWQVCYMQEIA